MNNLNSYLDKIVGLELQIFKRSFPAFQFCGYTGLALAILLGLLLGIAQGLAIFVLVGILGIAILTFLGLAMVTRGIVGEERLIYYHHEIAVMVMAAIFLKIINRPLLPYLDITILGIGIFLACGRVGCLMVGCCHGRPHKWGVCYRQEHADSGFTHYYVGMRLFPIQAVESLWVFFLVIVGTIFVLGKYPPGEALAWYVIHYDIGRFIMEFFRGDPERPYYCGYSEGQWLSVILMAIVVWVEMAGGLTFHLWHVMATVGMILIMIAVAVTRYYRRTAGHLLLNPRHVREIAEAIEQVSQAAAGGTVFAPGNPAPQTIPMSTTSLGIQISAGKIKEAETVMDHYAFSSNKGIMSKETAGTLADLIIRLRNFPCAKKLITRDRGMFHLLICPLNEGGEK